MVDVGLVEFFLCSIDFEIVTAVSEILIASLYSEADDSVQGVMVIPPDDGDDPMPLKLFFADSLKE